MPRFANIQPLLATQFKASLRNQSGFSLLDLLVKLVFLTGLVAIATPIYFGYKQIQIWEAWTRLSYMAEICTNKAIKIKELETCVPSAISSVSLAPLEPSPHFIFDRSPTCTTNASTFTATGYGGEVKGETLSVTVTVGKTSVTKTWGGSLFE